MQSVENLRAAANSLQAAKRAAKSDDLFTLADKAWAQTSTAMRHAQLVGRFERASASELALSNKLAGQVGRALVAEQARQRSRDLLLIAKNHREAAERCAEAGDKLAAEVRAKTPKPEAKANGSGGSGSREGNPTFTRGDELPLSGSMK